MNFLAHSVLAISVLLPCGLGAAATQAETPPPWTAGFDQARQRALQSRKDILLAFTIRRLDAASRHFEQHFLLQPAFAGTLASHFELVWVDCSEHGGDQEDSPAFHLRRQFEVNSFPTVVLTNWLGQPYAYTGLRPGSLESYLEHLQQLRQKDLVRKEVLKRARSAEGLRRAELLASAIPELGQCRSAKFYADIMREILLLDPDQQNESTRQIRRQVADLEFSRKMQELDRDLRWTEMVDLINRYIADQKLTGAHRQAALMDRLDVHRRQDDLPRVVETLEEIVRINPYNRHGQQASMILGQIASELKNQATLANPNLEK